LTVVQGGSIQRAVPVTSEPLVVGRDPSRAFHLPDADVSRSHCSVRLVADTVLVRDLSSTNGTFIDGVRVVGERPWPVSAHLQVGRNALKHELLLPEEVARREQLASELERARRYVEALIPAPLVRGPLRIEWCFVPSSVLGGDALGYHELGGGRIAIYVLDVCGHGVASAMHSASVLNAVRSQTLPSTDFADPSCVLKRLNDAFQMENQGGMYFSFFYGIVDPAERRIRYSSAGHPPAIVIGARGEVRDRLSVRNPPVGTSAGRRFRSAECAFEPGDRLYLFSDGAYEICDRDGRDRTIEEFEQELVASRRSDVAGEPRRLYEAACAASETELLEDDFTMLVVDHAAELSH
jgi:sigma-B regulation protein RsbU (phosphoserine phosphatase)